MVGGTSSYCCLRGAKVSRRSATTLQGGWTGWRDQSYLKASVSVASARGEAGPRASRPERKVWGRVHFQGCIGIFSPKNQAVQDSKEKKGRMMVVSDWEMKVN